MREKHRLRIKRAYDPPAQDDGQRVLIDRLWPRGLRKAEAMIDLWLKDAAPSDALRRWFGHDPARWEEFRARYAAELAERPEAVGRLRRMLHEGPVTLLFAAHDQEHNNAVALRDFLLHEGDD
jgi:uncharacterized protein YeaO (DUF488 family)